MVKTLSSTAVGTGSVSGDETRILHASQPSKTKQNIKQRQYFNQLNKDFKNGPHQKNIKKNCEREINTSSFAVTPQVAKIMAPVAPVHDAYLVKMKKSLSFVQ